MTLDKFLFTLLHITTIIIMFLFFYIARKKNKKQINYVFLSYLALLFIWCIVLITETYLYEAGNPLSIYFDNLTYIGAGYSPLTFFLIGMVFSHTRIKPSYKHLLLLIVPTLTNIMVWTNQYHHLFYKQFSFSTVNSSIQFGSYFFVHLLYSYIFYFIGLFYLLYFSIKNSGFFSRQALLTFTGSLAPIIVNIFVTIGMFPASPYLTPISFLIAIIFYMFAILKYEFLNISPIALQNVVDRISDSFVVVNEDLVMIDFNMTFLNTFSTVLKIRRNADFMSLFENEKIDGDVKEQLLNYLGKTRESKSSNTFELHFKMDDFEKFLSVEVTPIISHDSYLGTIVLMKDITQAKKDLETIKENQSVLLEQERLASLGQLIGGIAHNLKTPIMSLSGGIEALSDLAQEYRDSIDDENVTKPDHKEIAKDMLNWLDKMKPYCTYMSDVISAVKGQAVQMNTSNTEKFTVDELVKRVDLLMKHELKKYHCALNIKTELDMNTEIKGEINNLVQVFDNIIINAIHAYEGKSGIIDFIIVRSGDNVEFTFRDYGRGIPQNVSSKLFKEMVTTKGKNGTGLGLYISYATIKGRFGGNMSFSTKEGLGTTFLISIPCLTYAGR